MAATKVYAGTIGLQILIDMVDTITGATALALHVKYEGGKEATLTPTINGTTKLAYITQAGDLVAGIMKIQPQLTIGSWTGLGEVVSLTVYDRFG